jgi:hypothetical protein
MFDDADLIHRYGRADALRDGVLIDVSATAREAGLRWPVALTRAARGRCVTVPPAVVCQGEAGRLWGVAWMLARAICRGGSIPNGLPPGQAKDPKHPSEKNLYAPRPHLA